MVVAASDKAYGAHDELPYREELRAAAALPLRRLARPRTDLIARSYFHTYGLPVAVTRFANLYGGGDLNRSRLVPEAVAAALRRPRAGHPLRRHARARLPLRRGRGRRLPGDRRRAADDGGAAARRSTPAAASRTPCSRSSRWSARLAGTDVEPDIRGTGTPRGEIDRQYVDSTQAARAHGLGARRSSCEEGLRRTIEWYRDHPGALDA